MAGLGLWPNQPVANSPVAVTGNNFPYGVAVTLALTATPLGVAYSSTATPTVDQAGMFQNTLTVGGGGGVQYTVTASIGGAAVAQQTFVVA